MGAEGKPRAQRCERFTQRPLELLTVLRAALHEDLQVEVRRPAGDGPELLHAFGATNAQVVSLQLGGCLLCQLGAVEHSRAVGYAADERSTQAPVERFTHALEELGRQPHHALHAFAIEPRQLDVPQGARQPLRAHQIHDPCRYLPTQRRVGLDTQCH